VPIQQGLDDVSSERFDDDEERRDLARPPPSFIDGRAERERHHGGENRSDVGHKAEQPTEHAPEGG